MAFAAADVFFALATFLGHIFNTTFLPHHREVSAIFSSPRKGEVGY
jgi:hypothetical protein